MPTFTNPADDAHEAREALRALAHATRSIEDPREIYSVLGSLTSAVASLGQSFHQLAALHDRKGGAAAWVRADSAAARSAAYRISWDLHRAGEMLRQVSAVIDHAHELEASLSYHREFPTPPLTGQPPSHGISL